MNKIKKNIIKLFENGTWVLIALFILEIILSMFITPNLYDDKWFMEQITNELNEETGEVIEHTINDFVKDRYFTWSSRVILEFTLCSVLRISKYLWVLIEALMVTLVAYSISKIFTKKDHKQNVPMLVSMILIYPYVTMHETGWASTTINYMWTLATCLFALIPIKQIWDKEKIKIWQYPLYMIALIFAGNQEQTAAILLGFYLIFAIIMIAKNKKIHIFMCIQTILCIASIVFILTCPGNYVRQVEEGYRFIDYEMLTGLDKTVLAFTSTFGQIIKKQDLAYTLFTSMIAVYVFANYKDKLYRVVSIIPVLSIVVLGHASGFFFNVFPNLEVFYNLMIKEDVMFTVANCNNLYNAFPVIFAFVNFICIILSLILLTKKYNNNLALLIFLAGFASKFIIAFSPTVFVSKLRTMIYLDFAMIIISYMIWQKLNDKNKDKEKLINITSIVIKTTAVIQYLNVLVYIYSNQKLY